MSESICENSTSNLSAAWNREGAIEPGETCVAEQLLCQLACKMTHMKPKLISATRKQYFPVKTYKEAIYTLDLFTKIILFQFAIHSTGIKDNIIRNFIARGIVALKSIMKLWEISDYQDCWVLHRCILDRLFHLEALAKDDTFELFERWSFKHQYDSRNKIRSDPDFKERINPEFFKDMDVQKERYIIISKERPQWRRPKPQEVAKEMDLDFLYKYGYDYASKLVHPMATDGEEDFYRETKLSGRDFFIDQRVIINNSCMAVIILINEGLSYSNLIWRRLTFDFLKNFMDFLENGSEKYKVSFYKIGSLGPDVDLCKKATKEKTTKR